MDPLELVPLGRAVIPIRETIVLEQTPTGTLMVGEIEGARWEGERFSARQRGSAAADWLSIAPDGTASVDVRLTLETAAGEIVYVEYTGRSNMETGDAYATPLFRTGAPGLAWLNRIQAVAKGHWDGDAMTLTYAEIYELR